MLTHKILKGYENFCLFSDKPSGHKNDQPLRTNILEKLLATGLPDSVLTNLMLTCVKTKLFLITLTFPRASLATPAASSRHADQLLSSCLCSKITVIEENCIVFSWEPALWTLKSQDRVLLLGADDVKKKHCNFWL